MVTRIYTRTGTQASPGTKLDADIDNTNNAVNAHEVATAAHGATGAVVGTTNTQTLTGKTLTSPVLTTPQINDTSADHQYVFAPSELAADRTVTLPLLAGDDEFVFKDFTQTLTNKTLTSPDINGGTWNGTIDGAWTAAGQTCANLGTVTTLSSITNDTTINSLTVGRGTGAEATNSAFGYQSLLSNTTGNNDSAFGYQALSANTTGVYNSAFGYKALYSNTTGTNNSAMGNQALVANTSGVRNSAFGYFSLLVNTIGTDNSAFGYQSLIANTTGIENSAFGITSLWSNTTGNYNSAFGVGSMTCNTTASGNSAFGHDALYANSTGTGNSAFGKNALMSVLTGADNSAFGYYTLDNTTGTSNSAFGRGALGDDTTGNSNCAFGSYALANVTTGNNNIGLGYQAGMIGSPFNLTTESNRIVLGNNNITNAYIVVAWTVTCDARDKTDIKVSPYGIDYVLQLKPVLYKWDRRTWYKDEKDGSKKDNKYSIGFLAQDIFEVERNLALLNDIVVDTEEEENLKIKETALIPILVRAIQELKLEIENLKNQIKGNSQCVLNY